MQANDLGRSALIKMATYRVADLLPERLQSFRFRKDRLPQGAGSETAFYRFFYEKNDFVHTLLAKREFRLPNFRCSGVLWQESTLPHPANNSMSATFLEAHRQSGSDPSDSDWIGWLKRELAPTSARKIRTAIIVAGAVLCVIISMALQVPELATSAYMVFFISKESKLLTTVTGVGAVIVLTISIGATLLLYKFTYGHPELRIPGMAIALFLGMWLSRALVIGQLGFLFGFVVAVSQSVGEEIPSPELLVRGLLWLWVALAYAIAVTVVLNLLFLPDPPKAAEHPPKPKGSEPDRRGLFVPDAFTNPAHVHFALKVTFAAMFCYIVYEAIDWSGIHTALITCTFIALESTEATLYKGTLRIVGCVIGGALALFSIVFLMPHMETITSLVVLVACASAIAGWVATGSQRISYAGLQLAFAFFYSVFQGYAPDTDLDNVRNRVVGILFGLIVTGLVFQYIWPERAADRIKNPKEVS
jgi:uncharacterized membrane protein YccC